MKTLSIETPDGLLSVPALTAETAGLEAFISRRDLRRTDHHTRMALLACLLAVEDAKANGCPAGGRIGIVVGTGYGATCNRFDTEGFGACADIAAFSPIQFSNSVHNAAGARIAASLSARGPNLSINQLDLSVGAALLTAGQWLIEQRVDRVLVGGVDDFARVMAYHRHQQAPAAADGFPAVIGEGSAFFLLAREGEAASGYGHIHLAAVEGTGGADGRIPEADFCIIGADGLSPGEDGYGRRVQGRAAVYSPVYGNLPSGMAFDVAAAALAIRADTLFSTASCVPDRAGGPALIRMPAPVDGRRIRCLKISAAGGAARVILGRD